MWTSFYVSAHLLINVHAREACYVALLSFLELGLELCQGVDIA